MMKEILEIVRACQSDVHSASTNLAIKWTFAISTSSYGTRLGSCIGRLGRRIPHCRKQMLDSRRREHATALPRRDDNRSDFFWKRAQLAILQSLFDHRAGHSDRL